MSRACPYPACEKELSSGTFACRPHWYLLPKVLRDAVTSAWRSYLYGDGSLERLRSAQSDAEDFYAKHAADRGIERA